MSSTHSASAAFSSGAKATPSRPHFSSPAARASRPFRRKSRARCAARRSPPATKISINTATFPMRHTMRAERAACVQTVERSSAFRRLAVIARNAGASKRFAAVFERIFTDSPIQLLKRKIELQSQKGFPPVFAENPRSKAAKKRHGPPSYNARSSLADGGAAPAASNSVRVEKTAQSLKQESRKKLRQTGASSCNEPAQNLDAQPQQAGGRRAARMASRSRRVRQTPPLKITAIQNYNRR